MAEDELVRAEGLLDSPVPEPPGAAYAHFVQSKLNEMALLPVVDDWPVFGPGRRFGALGGDVCRPVELPGGETVVVRGAEPLSEEGAAAMAALVAAVRRRMPAPDPDAAKLYAQLDQARSVRGLSWRALAAEADVRASLLSRLANGMFPGVEDWVKLIRWLVKEEQAVAVRSQVAETSADAIAAGLRGECRRLDFERAQADHRLESIRASVRNACRLIEARAASAAEVTPADLLWVTRQVMFAMIAADVPPPTMAW